MVFLKDLFNKNEKHFASGGKLERFFPIFELVHSFLFTPGTVTKSAPHVRDFLDLKRLMSVVYIALIPATLMALYNTGLQANLAIVQSGGMFVKSWQTELLTTLGIAFDPDDFFATIVHGALYFLPVYFVTMAVGGFWEGLFAIVRRHEINEGFLVTSLLFPLILPPTIPYWQVALGISFGVVIGKEVFGGVGMNVFNPALVGRVFLFFAYPAQLTGDAVWIAVDGMSQATPLALMADPAVRFFDGGGQVEFLWGRAFLGFVPGSMGETSVLACLIGACILIFTGIGSWRIMVGVIFGALITSLVLNILGSTTNPMFQVPFVWHFVVGGFAFGTVFMATDPVSAAQTNLGRWLYGILIGFLIILIRVLNPAYPEGVMLAILFGNVFAPAFDRIVVYFNIKKRALKYGS